MATLRDAFSRIAQRLKYVWEEFGPIDFPADAGISFRDAFITFAQGFTAEFRHPEQGDVWWFEKNVPLFERLNADQLIRIIGILHFFAITRFYQLRRRKVAAEYYHKYLDWILSTYDFTGSAAEVWNQIAQTGGEKETEEKMYSEIADILGSDRYDIRSQEFMSGLGFVLLHGYEPDRKFCNEIFAGD